MAKAQTQVGEGSRSSNGVGRGCAKGGRYARYTEEQMEVLEKVYAECSNPDHLQRAQIIREHPILSDIDLKQLKVWFQNRRCREKQKKENGNLVSENRRLTAANKLLREENDSLQKKVAQLMCENEHLRNQVLGLTSSITDFDLGCQPEGNRPQMPIRIADSNKGLLSLAEETRKEFLSKAIGNAIKWTPAFGLKLHSLGSVGTLYVSSTCIGVAARACVSIPFEPVKTIEILKDRTSWSRHCRNMDVIAKYPVNNGGTIECIHTQDYAPTIFACARDFWTIRYTSVLDDGSFVICEKSITSSEAAPSSPAALEFVRGKMLASGYLICPNEGGSSIYSVAHLDLEALSVPDVVRPLYESSELLAKKVIVSAFHYIEHMVNEKNDKHKHACREDPAFLRSFSQRLCRGFNDAVNCFFEDGWTLMNNDASDGIIMSVKQTKSSGVYANYDSVICVKASLLLQNVLPASLVRILKERRSSWMDFNFASHSVAFSQAACLAYPALNTHDFSETSVLLGHTSHEDETLEVIRFGCTVDHQRNVSSGDLYHLQIINGMEDMGFGACSELIFAPIDRNIPNDAVLLSSGFRIFLLGSDTGATSSASSTSNETFNSLNAQADISNAFSLLILAFQFPFEAHLQDDVAAMARQYIQHVIFSVKNLSLEVMPSELNPEMNCTNADRAMEITPESTYAVNLANLIFLSYRSALGVDILGFNCQTTDSTLEQIQNHLSAILCFSFKSLPVCMYANHAALNMLETTTDNLHMLSVDSILGGSNNLSLVSVLPMIMQQRYAILPPGHCLSVMNHCVSYGQAVVWQVLAPNSSSIHCLAFAFLDWSFT